MARLKDVARRISSCLDLEQQSRDKSASLDLLLRFQRLLISKLYPGESIGQTSDTSSKLLKCSSALCVFPAFLCRFWTSPLCVPRWAVLVLFQCTHLGTLFCIHFYLDECFCIRLIDIFFLPHRLNI